MALDDSVEAELEEDNKEDELEEERVMPSEFVLGFGDSNDNGEHFDEEMDLDTPPDISVELGQEEEATEEPEQEEQAGEEETENQEEEKEEGDDSGHADSISGVQIESYQPEEDLIYEGDVDSEAPAVVDIQVHPEVTTEDVNDEVQVHDFEAELDKKIKQTKSSSSSDKAKSAEKSDSKFGKKASSSEKDGRSAVGGSDSSSSRFVYCCVCVLSLSHVSLYPALLFSHMPWLCEQGEREVCASTTQSYMYNGVVC